MYSDHPRLDTEYPEIGEAQKIVDMIMDMSRGDKAVAMEMLKNAMGMIQGEMDVAAEPMMQEGFENITPENLSIVLDAVKKMAPLLGAMSLPVLMLAIRNAFKAQAGTAEQDRGAM
jgi:hypothetical protein